MDILRPSSRRLILLIAALALALVLLALLPSRASAPEARPTAIAARATVAAVTPSPAPVPSSPTSAPTPQPQIAIRAAAGPLTITFGLRGQIPAGAAEALLWYDTAAGHTTRRIELSGAQTISAGVAITPRQEGLTLTEMLDGGLDYWWAVRDQHGAITRRAGSLALPAALESLAQTAPITAPAQLAWVEQATPHFRLFAPPQSAAARDLGELRAVAEAGYAQAASVITTTRSVSVAVYLTPRVFWQGGVAYSQGNIIAISYLDRNYAGVANWTYFVHEVTHALSAYALPRGAEIGGVLGEGVAVYATGGHYGREPIDAWAAILAASDRYVPLCRLRYDFYAAQHEIAYQEAASFAGYLIRRYGLERFQQIYAVQKPQRGDQKLDIDAFCAADNRQIVVTTGASAAQIERDWLAYLKTIQPTTVQRSAWDLKVRFFETMRSYQEQFDQPARDLPPPPNSWDRATAAKFLNAATGRRAATLETMLAAALPAIQRGDLGHATALLDATEASLAAGGTPTTPLARDYEAIVGLLAAQSRALRLGDTVALEATLMTPGLAAALPFTTSDLLHDLRFTLQQLDVRNNTAEGMVQADGERLDGRLIERALYHARFTHAGGGWRLAEWAPQPITIELPPGAGAVGGER